MLNTYKGRQWISVEVATGPSAVVSNPWLPCRSAWLATAQVILNTFFKRKFINKETSGKPPGANVERGRGRVRGQRRRGLEAEGAGAGGDGELERHMVEESQTVSRKVGTST